jgi:hypothetical protein
MMPPLPPPNGTPAIPRHPGRKRLDFIEGDVGMVADAALGGTERDGMLYAIAREHFDVPVVHEHRARHCDLPLGAREYLPDTGVQVEQASRAGKLLEHRVVRAVIGRHACLHAPAASSGPSAIA